MSEFLEISRSDFDNWKNHPVTKIIMESLTITKEGLEGTLYQVKPSDFTDEGIHGNFFYRGCLSVYKKILDIRYSDISDSKEVTDNVS